MFGKESELCLGETKNWEMEPFGEPLQYSKQFSLKQRLHLLTRARAHTHTHNLPVTFSYIHKRETRAVCAKGSDSPWRTSSVIFPWTGASAASSSRPSNSVEASARPRAQTLISLSLKIPTNNKCPRYSRTSTEAAQQNTFASVTLP